MSDTDLEPLKRFQRRNPPLSFLSDTDFTLSNGTSGEREKIAEFTPDAPLTFVKNEPLQMAFVYHEAFEHTGSGTAEATFSLSLDVYDTPVTDAVEVYADDTQLAEGDATPDDDEFYVDYDADEVTVDVDTDVTIHVFYVARDPLEIEIVKEKGGTVNAIDQQVFSGSTAILHTQDQFDNGPTFGLNESVYQGFVPEKWTVKIYAKGSAYGIDWDDSDTDTSGNKTVDDVTPTNAIIRLPVEKVSGQIPGLNEAVTKDVALSAF